MILTRRRFSTTALGSALSCPALAQAPWPKAGPVRLVVPFTAGETTDIIAYVLANEMGQRLGQSVVRSGAGGTLGTGQVACATPDDYMIVLSMISAMVVGKVLCGLRVTRDPFADFPHVAMVFSTPYLLLVRPDNPIRSLADLTAAAKAWPDTLSHGTTSIDSMAQLTTVRFSRAAEIGMQHVPYRGGPQIVTDAVSGLVPVMVDSFTAASTNMRAGTLRALAQTWPERVPDFLNVATFRELGYSDLIVVEWAGIATPACMPAPIVEQLAGVIRDSLASADFHRRSTKTASSPGSLFLNDARRYVEAELAAWTPIVHASGASAD